MFAKKMRTVQEKPKTASVSLKPKFETANKFDTLDETKSSMKGSSVALSRQDFMLKAGDEQSLPQVHLVPCRW